MRLGISSYTYTWAVGVPGAEPVRPMTALDLLDRAAEMGVGVVQIADNLPLHTLPPDDLDALAARARELGIVVEVGTRGIRPDHLRTYLDLALRLGSPILRVVVDTADDKPDADEVVKLLSGMIRLLGNADVKLAIENHDRFPSAALARIIDRLGSDYVGICLDTVNSFGALEGPEVVVGTLAPYTINLHVKDFTVRRAGHQMGFTIEGAPAGKGRLDIPWLFGRIRDAGRDPNAILELWTPPEASVDDTIAKEARWARESVTYLRGLLADS